MSERPQFELTFLGGASAIGASCTLLRFEDTRILIDGGIRFNASHPLPDLSVLSGVHIDAIFVTHAHTDHTGALPVLCEAFPEVQIFTTAPTMALVKILLMDSLKIMNAEERDGEAPLYSEHQVKRVLENLVPISFYQPQKVNEIEIQALPASHILGAAMFHFSTPAGAILFTGDYSVTPQLTVPALTRPALSTDLIVTESTYGQRLHEDRASAENRLVSQVAEIVEKGGKVLIPAFAVGRAQEVLLILKNALRRNTLPQVPVFVDGMVRAVCDIYRQYDTYTTNSLSRQTRKEKHPFYMNGIVPVAEHSQRQTIITGGPCVIVASSGMLTGGASAFYARALAGGENNAILITGYQDEESPGGKLLELAEATGEKELILAGARVKVLCAFRKYGLSAHADRMQMIGLIESLRPKTVVLVHGDAEARSSLAKGITCRDIVLAAEGGSMERGYPVRKITDGFTGWADGIAIDEDSAKRLLGPPHDKPLPARGLAEAWFGKKVGGPVLEQFIQRLEALALVRRDDNNRHLLRMTERALSGDEGTLEEDLKSENAKGKLLEMCMKLHLPGPEMVRHEDARFHAVSLRLLHENNTLSTEIHKASSLKAAEHLASRELLGLLIDRQDVGDYRNVDDAMAARNKIDNPKGKLLERVFKDHLPSPRFEMRVIDKGVLSKAGVTLADNRTLQSAWYLASNQKAADQASSHDLIRQWEALEKTGDPPQPQAAAPEAQEQSMRSPSSVPDALLQLNLMKQRGYIHEYGVDTLAQSGPSHCPVYLMRGWLQLAGGGIHNTPEAEFQSKKQGKKELAVQLVEMLGQLIME